MIETDSNSVAEGAHPPSRAASRPALLVRTKDFWRSAFAGQVAWVTGLYVATQVLRLASNVVLARLLAPELFGTMMLINTLRMACELFTDLGIGQAMITQPQGDSPRYFGTAWTIQLIRGLLLFALGCALTPGLAMFYGEPQLNQLIPAASLIFVFTGLTSPSRFVLQKHMRVRELMLFDFAGALVTSIVSVALAWIMPGIWALMWGFLLGSALPAFASYFLVDFRLHRLTFDRGAIRSMFSFGKWVFVSSLIYFSATNFDRLYFAKEIPMAMVGVYGIAKTYSESAMLLFHRLGTVIMFPRIAAHAQRGEQLRAVIAPKRRLALAGIAVALGLGVAGSDTLIDAFYDSRYGAAGPMLSMLLAGTWFAILAVMADAMIMGVGAPSGVALGNAIKLAWIVIALPLALSHFGVMTAVAVLAAADAFRYLALVFGKRRQGLNFIRQDIAFTALFLFVTILSRGVAGLMGINGGVGSWIDQVATLHA